MDGIKIIGNKTIQINDNPENVITFNPTDVLFVERFYSLFKEFQDKQIEYEKMSKEIDEKGKELDADGIPTNVKESMVFLKEVCTFMREKFDELFGAGTSQKAFGDALSLDMIVQFLEGVTPFISEVRKEKIAKYLKN